MHLLVTIVGSEWLRGRLVRCTWLRRPSKRGQMRLLQAGLLLVQVLIILLLVVLLRGELLQADQVG